MLKISHPSPDEALEARACGLFHAGAPSGRSAESAPCYQAPPDLDERRVERRVVDRSLRRRHQRLRQHRHDPVHLGK